MAMAKNGMASPQRVGREPPLDKPHERLTRPGQCVGRTGKREYLVGHRVVRAIPLHREALLTPLHVAGQGPEGEHLTPQRWRLLDCVSDPAGVQRPQPAMVAENPHYVVQPVSYIFHPRMARTARANVCCPVPSRPWWWLIGYPGGASSRVAPTSG
jgi:hypothetical protein